MAKTPPIPINIPPAIYESQINNIEDASIHKDPEQRIQLAALYLFFPFLYSFHKFISILLHIFIYSSSVIRTPSKYNLLFSKETNPDLSDKKYDESTTCAFSCLLSLSSVLTTSLLRSYSASLESSTLEPRMIIY